MKNSNDYVECNRLHFTFHGDMKFLMDFCYRTAYGLGKKNGNEDLVTQKRKWLAVFVCVQ